MQHMQRISHHIDIILFVRLLFQSDLFKTVRYKVYIRIKFRKKINYKMHIKKFVRKSIKLYGSF